MEAKMEVETEDEVEEETEDEMKVQMEDEVEEEREDEPRNEMKDDMKMEEEFIATLKLFFTSCYSFYRVLSAYYLSLSFICRHIISNLLFLCSFFS